MLLLDFKKEAFYDDVSNQKVIPHRYTMTPSAVCCSPDEMPGFYERVII